MVAKGEHTYRVVAGTQVVSGGVLYGAGETFAADPDDVRSEVALGLVTAVPAPSASKHATKGGAS